MDCGAPNHDIEARISRIDVRSFYWSHVRWFSEL
jgi:hypothetical protein